MAASVAPPANKRALLTGSGAVPGLLEFVLPLLSLVLPFELPNAKTSVATNRLNNNGTLNNNTFFLFINVSSLIMN